jgi:hypothetical protein
MSLHFNKLFESWCIVRVYCCRDILFAHLCDRLNYLDVSWLRLLVPESDRIPVAIISELLKSGNVQCELLVPDLVFCLMLLHHGLESLLSAKPYAKFLLDFILQLLPLLVILFHEPFLRF